MKGTVRLARGVGLDHAYTVPSWTANWMFTRPTVFRARAIFGVLADLLDHVLAQVEGREHGVAVAAVDAGGFDVLHDADDAHHLPVADGVGLGLDGAVQEVVVEDLCCRASRGGCRAPAPPAPPR